MPKVKVNGIELYYKIQGAGEPLLLIAGFLCDHSYWSLVMPSLVKQYQVIRLDNRGIGQSSTPDSPYSIKQMATDAAGVLDQLGITKVHVAVQGKKLSWYLNSLTTRKSKSSMNDL